jgi:CubicO group peptidase (beta-lactamase class C family)
MPPQSQRAPSPEHVAAFSKKHRACLLATGVITTVMFPQLQLRGAASSEPLSEEDFSRIDSYVETQLQEAGIPGAALVIVERDEITHVRGFGFSVPQEQPVTADTVFFLGSVSKSFTALAIMQLVEAGRVDLDAPVRKYLPWFRVADTEATGQITVRHLLHHTSGLSTYAGRTHLSRRDTSDEAIDRRVRALRKVRPTAGVGERYQYSNANYSTLGAIIEAASGHSYEDYIQEHIFDPLEITSSFTSVEEAKRHNMVTGYRYWFGQPIPVSDLPYSRGDVAAAYLTSCAKDMGNYLLAHMNGGAFHSTRILSEDGITKMQTPEKNSYYAMGWIVGSVNGRCIISHNGVTPTSYAYMAMLPEQERGYVLLVNAGNFLSGPDIHSFGVYTSIPLLGLGAPRVSKAPKLHTELAMLCVLLLGQFVGLAFECRRIYHWWKHPGSRPRKKRWVVVIRASLSFIVGLVIVGGLLWWVPQSRDIPLAGLILYAPDAGWLLLINGALALVGLTVSIGVTVFLLRRSIQARTVTGLNESRDGAREGEATEA